MNKPFEFSASGLIDFEVLEPAQVARELGKTETDEGPVSDPLSVIFGRSKDSKQPAGERMVAGATIDWLLGFQPELRPKVLCERFPHIANRLASHWADKAASVQSLQQMADDSRWGTPGYAGQVQTELARLLALRKGAA